MSKCPELKSENERLKADIERLRGLLESVVDDMVLGEDFENLLVQIEKEVGGE